MTTPTARGAVAVTGAAVLWGSVGPAQVLAGSAADPGALGVMRLLVGGSVLALLSWRHATLRRVFARGVLRWVALAAGATGAYQVLFMHAVAQAGAGLATAIALGVAPVATGLCARWWTKTALTGRWVTGTAGAVLGCGILLSPTGAAGASGAGVGAAVLSGCCYGIYTVAAKRCLDAGAPLLAVAATTLLLAGVALSPLLALLPAHLADVSSLALVAWTGLVGTAAAYALFTLGLQRLTAPLVGTLSLLEPLTAVLISTVVLHETFGPEDALGSALLLAGLAVTALARPRRRPHGRAPHSA